jgi:hypothetical protein
MKIGLYARHRVRNAATVNPKQTLAPGSDMRLCNTSA